MGTFRVGITSDFADGSLIGGWIDDPVRELFSGKPDLEWEFLPPSGLVMDAGLVGDYDAVISGEVRWTPASFSSAERLALVACWGIGVDGIDLGAATEAHVAVSNSPSAGNHASVAESALMMVLALSKRLLTKNRLTKQGLGLQAQELLGTLIQGRTIGTVGFGATARAFARMVRSLRPAELLAYDPYVEDADAAELGVELVDLAELMRRSDYVVVMCTLSAETRGLINEELLGLMKPTAFIVNTARGPIIDQAALVRILQSGAIGGAGLDVTEREPPPADDPILGFEDVLVTGHASAWTVESLQGACQTPCQTVLSLYEGQEPNHVVNRGVLKDPAFEAKLSRYRRPAGDAGGRR